MQAPQYMLASCLSGATRGQLVWHDTIHECNLGSKTRKKTLACEDEAADQLTFLWPDSAFCMRAPVCRKTMHTKTRSDSSVCVLQVNTEVSLRQLCLQYNRKYQCVKLVNSCAIWALYKLKKVTDGSHSNVCGYRSCAQTAPSDTDKRSRPFKRQFCSFCLQPRRNPLPSHM